MVSLNQILMVMSTPAGKLSFFNSSTVFAVGSRMSISRLWVRCSKVSCDFLSECGERWTVKRSIRVGSGMGPATRAPVRLTVSAMSRADWLEFEALVRAVSPQVPTQARAHGIVISALLEAGRTALPRPAPGPFDWMDWERQKTLKLLRGAV